LPTIYISALMFGGFPGTFLDVAFGRAFTLVTSRGDPERTG
jgi:hypothetical protein